MSKSFEWYRIGDGYIKYKFDITIKLKFYIVFDIHPKFSEIRLFGLFLDIYVKLII